MKNIIFENFWYKILSVICGFLLWFMVIGQQNSEINVEVPIEFKNVPENYIITDSEINKVSILLKGPSTLLKLLTKKNISFPVNLSNIHKGKNIIILNPDMLELPHKISIKFINPARITLYVDKMVTKEKKVVPEFNGKLFKGYKMVKIKINPLSVKVIGAEEELKRIQNIKTVPIDITNKKESFEIEVPLERNFKYVRDIIPSSVKVSVIISEKLINMTLKNIPVHIKTDLNLKNYKIYLIPNKINIQILINENIKNLITKKDFYAFVELLDLETKHYNILINKPENIHIIKVIPDTVRIKIKKIRKP